MTANRPLRGKTALVTGASRGVGAAIAKELAELGATVVVTARTDVRRDDIAGTIGETVQAIEDAGGIAVAMKADLLVPAELNRLVDDTLAAYGHVDVVVNNAAYIGDGVFESVWEMSPETWRNMIELNVNVAWALTKAFAPVMRDRVGGLVVNLGSTVSHLLEGPAPLPGAGGLGAAYPTSKAALAQMNAFVGNELRAYGITSVALDPGFARSESAEILASRIGADAAWAQPVEIAAKAVGYLATCSHQLEYAGRFVVARELVDEHKLMPL